MMDYELFKDLVQRRIKEYLPPIFHNYEPQVQPVPKVNGTKDAFCMFPPEPNRNVAVPTLYLDDLYEHFTENEDLDEILKSIAQVIMTWSGMEVPELAEFRLEDHTDCIVACLISTDLNEELLQKVPHREFMDMSVIYRLVHSINDAGINTMIITNEVLKKTDLTSEDLWKYSMENTPRIFPVKMIRDLDEGMIVVTNEAGFYGASIMLFDEHLRNLATHLGGDYYIMPTSMHEFFAISVERADPFVLVHMLADGNGTITEPEEQLSTTIYLYSAEQNRCSKVAGYAAAS